MIVTLFSERITGQDSFNKFRSPDGHIWESIGPEGGMVEQLIITPSNRDILYAVVEGGTVFRSTNRGSDWKSVSSFPRKCTFISIYSKNPDILYAVSNSMGVFKTSDGGESWSQIGWKSRTVTYLAIDPNDSDIIYLATANTGLYKSVDAGNSWVSLSAQEEMGWIQSIKIDPGRSNILYLLSQNLYRSSDYGNTWEKLHLGINGVITGFDIDPNNAERIFVSSSEGIYISNDEGRSFTLSNGGDIDAQHPWTESVMVNPFDPDLVYRSTNLMTYISTDGGRNWKVTAIPSVSFVMPATNSFLAASRDGIYSSDENCNNVNYISNGLYGTKIKSITSNPTDFRKILAITEDQGIALAHLFITVSDSVRWEKSFWGKGASELKIHPSNGHLIFGGFNWGKKGLNKSTDGGNTWYSVDLDDYIISLAFDPGDSDKIYAGCMRGLYRSDDLGEHWQRISIQDNNPLKYSEFKQIALSNDKKTIFLVSSYGYDWTYRNALLKTSDSGETWTECNLKANSVFVFPDDPDIVLCGQSTHIYRSTDSGINWSIVDPGFTNVSINSFQLIDENSIAAATSNGVYYSADKGETWSDFSDGLGNSNIQCLSLSKGPAPTLFAGTGGGGIYRKVIDDLLSVDSNNSVIDEFRLFNNYPNPFNPSTTIKFSISKPAFVTLKVYDMLGREITTLVNEEKQTGSYYINFDGSSHASGIYFYRFKAGGFAETKKLVLLK